MFKVMFTTLFIIVALLPTISQTPQELVKQVQQKYESLDNLVIEATFQHLYKGQVSREGIYFTAMDRSSNFIYQYDDTKKVTQYSYWKYATEELGTFRRIFGTQPAFKEEINIEEALSAFTGGTSHTGIDIPLLFYGFDNNNIASADSLILHPSESLEGADCVVLETVFISVTTPEERKEIKIRADSLALKILGFIPDSQYSPAEITLFKNKWWIRKKDYLLVKREETVVDAGEVSSTITEWLTVKEDTSSNVKDYIMLAQKN